MEDRYVEIPLTQGAITIVDEADFHLLVPRVWRLSNYGYAVSHTSSKSLGGTKILSMHRVIMGLEHGDRREVDHKDRNPLNNRRSNLRVCTSAQNKWNRPTAGGVLFHKKNRKWQGRLTVKGRTISAGYYHTREEAVSARDKLATELHGEFFVPGATV